MTPRIWTFGVLISLLTGCVSTAPPRHEPNVEVHLNGEIRQMQAQTLPGAIYALRARKAQVLLDIRSQQTFGAAAAWFRTQTVTDPDSIALGTALIQRPTRCPWPERLFSKRQCLAQSSVTLQAIAYMRTVETVADPFTLLDVFNRPVSGLIYNREAEARVMEWRSSLVAAIGDSPSGQDEEVGMCTVVQTALSGALMVTGEANAEEIASIITQINHHEPLPLRPETPAIQEGFGRQMRTSVVFDAPIAWKATFRRLSVVNGSTQPRIDFTLSGVIHTSLMAEERDTLQK